VFILCEGKTDDGIDIRGLENGTEILEPDASSFNGNLGGNVLVKGEANKTDGRMELVAVDEVVLATSPVTVLNTGRLILYGTVCPL